MLLIHSEFVKLLVYLAEIRRLWDKKTRLHESGVMFYDAKIESSLFINTNNAGWQFDWWERINWALRHNNRRKLSTLHSFLGNSYVLFFQSWLSFWTK